MTEVGVGYVQLLPSMRGFAGAVSRELGSELDTASGKVGRQAGGSFMSGFGDGVQRMGRATSGMGDRMAIGITLPLIAAGNQATNVARDTAENLSKVQTVFGAQSGKIEQFAESAASSFGLSRRAALEYTGTFGNMFSQIGFAGDATADMSVKMTQLAADFSSFHNLNTEDVLNAQAAAFRGEYDALQRVVPTINAAAVEQKALAMTGKESAKELTNQEKAAATYAFMIENAGAAAGDFARTSESLANVERTTAAEAENAAGTFGNQLIPVKQQLIGVATQLLEKFNALSPAQQEMIMKAGLLTAVLGPVLSVVGRLTTGLGGLFKGLGFVSKGFIQTGADGKKVAGPISRAVMAFGRLAKSAARAAFQVARAAFSMMVSAAKAAARVVASIALQIAKWALLGVKALLHAAKVALAWLIALGPIGILIAVVIAAVALIIMHWDKVSKFVVAAARWMADKAVAIFTFLKDWIWQWITDIVGFYASLPGMIVGFIVAIYDFIVKYLTLAKDWVAAKITDMVGFFSSLPGRVMGFITAVWSWIVDRFAAARDFVGGIIDAVVGFIGTLPGKALTFLMQMYRHHITIFNMILSLAGRGIDSLIGFFKRIPGRVRSAISRITDTIIGPFRSAFDAIKRLWNRTVGGFGFTVPSWIPGVGGRGFRIPRMHSGGIFQAATGNEGLAMLKSGERVLTESDQRQMHRYGGGAAAAQVEIVFSGRNNDLLMRWLHQQVRVKGAL